MDESIYKTVQITGTSPDSLEDAVNKAIHKASETLRQLRWFEVIEIRGEVENDHVRQWQVTTKLGFKLE